MRAKKFLFIATQLEFGGAQVKAVNLARELEKRGHTAEVWFLYRKRAAFTQLEQSRCLLPSKPTHLGQLIMMLGACTA